MRAGDGRHRKADARSNNASQSHGRTLVHRRWRRHAARNGQQPSPPATKKTKERNHPRVRPRRKLPPPHRFRSHHAQLPALPPSTPPTPLPRSSPKPKNPDPGGSARAVPEEEEEWKEARPPLLPVRVPVNGEDLAPAAGACGVGGGRAEIDTSAPFESVREAVDRFGSAAWSSTSSTASSPTTR
ncbi:hypothetical protein ZWY2020_038019 [Hordeum vulgare]|nr:hypothetical protein ZWY2020_038019 [Hordeum vulgare]